MIFRGLIINGPGPVRYVADCIGSVQVAVRYVDDFRLTGQGAIRDVVDYIETMQCVVRYVA